MSAQAHEPAPRRVAHRAARRSLVAAVLLLLYLLVLLGLTMAPHPREPAQLVNLIPFKSILAGIRRGGWLLNVNVLGNIAAFAPLGLLVPAVSRRASASGIVLCGLLTSTSIEVAQWFLARRVADVDDIILNVVGALLGYGWYVLLVRSVPHPDHKHES
ncbi:MAG TPA: VanZ family protein [Herpetosiphonaceae bacterium]